MASDSVRASVQREVVHCLLPLALVSSRFCFAGAESDASLCELSRGPLCWCGRAAPLSRLLWGDASYRCDANSESWMHCDAEAQRWSLAASSVFSGCGESSTAERRERQGGGREGGMGATQECTAARSGTAIRARRARF